MEEYLRLLLEQVRCKKAHPAIKTEIQAHMEEQIADYISNGMTPVEAEAAAVKDMGNPVETGISLDQIHKPQIAWDIIGIMALITIAGNILNGSGYFAFCSITGFIFMVLVYRLDYTFIARFSKIIAVLIMLLSISSILGGNHLNGRAFYIGYSRMHIIHIAVFPFLMLYVPVFGAVIYKYHGSGYRGILKSMVWMILPVLIAWCLPSLLLACMLLISMMTVLTAAILQGWFNVSRKRTIAGLWTAVIGIPIVSGLLFIPTLANYQSDRLKAFFTHTGAASYQENILSQYLHGSALVGRSADSIEIMRILPDWNNSFAFTYFSASYGLIIGIGICALLSLLMLKAFQISARQKNQLGMIMGIGSAAIISVNIVINILENVGLLPISQTFLPFFSRGGSCAVVCYILIGIILSVYRYKNIYAKHVSVDLPSVKMKIDL